MEATGQMAQEKDPSGIGQHELGAKLDDGKTRAWLCISGFSRALAEVARVTTKGAAKYTPNGWMHVENGVERYMDAFGRHLLALGKGELVDADTGCLHKAQMIWNLLASLELELRDQDEVELKIKATDEPVSSANVRDDRKWSGGWPPVGTEIELLTRDYGKLTGRMYMDGTRPYFSSNYGIMRPGEIRAWRPLDGGKS